MKARPEGVFLTVLTLAVLGVVSTSFRSPGMDGSLALAEAPVLPEVDRLEDLKELVVATYLAPTTYLTEPDGKTIGLDHDLALSFGRFLGKPVRFLVLDNLDRVLQAVNSHRAHLAAAAVPITPDLEDQFAFSPSYAQRRPQVAYNVTLGPAPSSPGDLEGHSLGVVPDPVHMDILKKLRQQYPELAWRTYPRGNVDLDLLQRVYEGTLRYAVSDSNLIAVARTYWPDLHVAFDLGPPTQLAWAFPVNERPDLLNSARQFFQSLRTSGELDRQVEEYYGKRAGQDPENVMAFIQTTVARLPQFSLLFKQAQSLSSLDWRLLAALGYQESHWDNNALSPTGVRGIMMLTADTADRLHVSHRLDPRDSIPAAAEYLEQLREALPERIPEPDRTWMALAAYNVGTAHLEDARILAQQRHLNPDRWTDVRSTLPLLSLPSVYPHTRWGFARGGEPVNFVDNIRTYYDILERYEKPYHPLAEIRALPPR